MTDEMEQTGEDLKTLKISCHNCMQKLDVTSLESFSHIACPVCGTDLIVPKWFDNYLLEEPGGSGGMATVYRALDLALDREVAIKVLSPELSDDPEKSELFLHEARTAATINHYAVVPIYTCGVYRGQSYIVMQYMPGGSLEEKLFKETGFLPLMTVAGWMRDVAEGLENARLHGIIHHDIKPGNILLDNEGHAKIGDFGIAQVVTKKGSDPFQNLAKSWISPHYVSPEKVRTEEEGFQGDIYSLGATFYHLVTGYTPFCHSDVEELIRMRLTETPAPPHVRREEVSLELSQLIMSMMSKNPPDRPPYKTIISVLTRYIKENSASTVPLPVRSIRNKADPRLVAELQSGAGRAPAKSSSTGSVVFFLLLAALAAGGGFFVWSEGYFNGLFSKKQIAVADSMADPNPEVTYYLAHGDSAAALAYCGLRMQEKKMSTLKRTTLVLQEAFAMYLEKTPAAPAMIEKRLLMLEQECSATELVNANAFVVVIRYLADPDGDIPDIQDADPFLLSVARFLASMKSEEKDLPERLNDMEAALTRADAGSWGVLAWKSRIPRWEQAILEKNGIRAEIEPLFQDSVKEEVAWTSTETAQSLPNHWADAESPDEDAANTSAAKTEDNASAAYTGAPDLSPEKLKAAAEKYKALKRPCPAAPTRIHLKSMKDYLKTLPEKERKLEQRRIRLMGQLAEYISQMSARNSYQADAFSDLSGTEYGEGVIMFNPKSLIFRGKKDSMQIDWQDVPAREMMSILLYYVTYREEAQKNMPKEFTDLQKELGMAYLRYALLCQWYGYYDEASKYGKKTLELLPGARTNRITSQFLLQ